MLEPFKELRIIAQDTVHPSTVVGEELGEGVGCGQGEGDGKIIETL